MCGPAELSDEQTTYERRDGDDWGAAIIKAAGRHDKHLRKGRTIRISTTLMGEMSAPASDLGRIRRLARPHPPFLWLVGGRECQIVEDSTLPPNTIVVGAP